MRMYIPLLMLGAVACGDGEPETTRIEDILSLTGDAANGAAVYTDRCSGCHGENGEGGIGPELGGVVPGLSDEALLTVVIDGIGSMPAASDLSDQNLADLHQHLVTTYP